MAGKTAIVALRILGDAKGARSAMAEAEGGASRLSGVLGGMGKVLGGVALAGAGALGALGVAGVKAAGDLEQSRGAIDTIFKDQAGVIHGYAQGAATSLGLTENSYNELAAVIATQLKNGGTSMEELGAKTNNLIGLGADLASMYGGSTTDAVNALSSALKGERDPIERYGISLTQASIDAKAAELGFKKVGGALDTNASQAATLALIMDQSTAAQGNFGRETGTFAGQVQILTAQWGNFVAQVGMMLLPALTSLLGIVTGSIMPALQQFADIAGPVLTEAISGLGPVITDLASGFTATAGAASPLSSILTVIAPVAESLYYSALMLGETLLAAGQTILPLILNAVNAILPILIQAAGTVLPAVLGIFSAAIPIFTQVAATIIPAVTTAFTTLMPRILAIVQPLAMIAQTIIKFLVPAFNAILPVVQTVIGAVVGILDGLLQAVGGVITVIAGMISGDWTSVWQGAQNILAGIWNAIVSLLTGVGNTIAGIVKALAETATRWITMGWQRIKSLTSGLWDTITGAFRRGGSTAQALISVMVRAVTGFISRLLSSVRSTFSNIASTIGNAARTASSLARNGFSALVSGVVGYIGRLLSNVRQIPGRIRAALGNLSGLLRGVGRNMIQGMINGIGSMGGALVSAAKRIAGRAVDGIKNFLGIHSPSRVFAQIGAFTGQGFIDGITGMSGKANRAVESLIEVPNGPTLPARAGRNRGSGAPVQYNYTITINGAIDKDGTARAIEELLERRARRTGRTGINGRVAYA